MTYEELHDIVLQHGKSIYSFCRYLTANADLADDLYQETFLKAAELCYKIDRTQNPKVFLIRIAASLWKNQLRKEKGRQRIFPLAPLESEADVISSEKPPEVLLIQQEEKQLLLRCAEKLPAKLRLPLYMYYTAELSLKEISQVLHIPVGTVKSRLWRAKHILKKELEVHGYETE